MGGDRRAVTPWIAQSRRERFSSAALALYSALFPANVPPCDGEFRNVMRQLRRQRAELTWHESVQLGCRSHYIAKVVPWWNCKLKVTEYGHRYLAWRCAFMTLTVGGKSLALLGSGKRPLGRRYLVRFGPGCRQSGISLVHRCMCGRSNSRG